MNSPRSIRERSNLILSYITAAGDKFADGINELVDLLQESDAKVTRAYEKLRIYKNQHSQLVSKHRLQRLEYKELKAKYDDQLRNNEHYAQLAGARLELLEEKDDKVLDLQRRVVELHKRLAVDQQVAFARHLEQSQKAAPVPQQAATLYTESYTGG